MVRLEDLLDPATRLRAIRRLAAFVGSAATTRELCCMARAPERR